MSEVVEPLSLAVFGFLERITSKLAANKNSNICVTSYDGNTWSLISCMFQGLQELNLENSCFATIEEIIGNYHEKYYSGCKMVLCLGSYLLKELVSLKNMNYDTNLISSAVLDCLEKDVVCQMEIFSKSLNISNIEMLMHLCQKFTKGHDIQIANALYEICMLQNINMDGDNENIGYGCSLSLKNVTFIHMSGSIGFKLKLHEGILVKPELNHHYWSDRIYRRIVLINGHLKRFYRHLGHKMPLNCTVVQSSVASPTSATDSQDDCEEKWLTDLLKVIEKHKIDTILITGTVDPYFLELCKNKKYDLTCLTNVPLDVLKLLASEMGSYTLDSLLDIWSEKCILKNIKIDEVVLQSSTYYRIYSDVRKDLFQSLVFYHVTEEWSKLKEEEFLHCAKKLEFSLKEPTNCLVVDGSGIIERNIAKHLNDKADQEEKILASDLQDVYSDSSIIKQVLVRRSLAEAFLKYYNLICNNLKWVLNDNITYTMEEYNKDVQHHLDHKIILSNCGDDSKCFESSYDNVEIKLASWRTAVYMACLLLRIDYQILRKED